MPFLLKILKGHVKFTEIDNKIKIDVSIIGLKPNHLHGFHVHEAGDLSDKCTSMCAHFNPYKMNHGCPGIKERHIGDLGNLQTNNKGEAKYTFYDECIKLRGTKANIIGRGLIIHADQDDCGQGGNAESLKTGNAGKRIACAVIGYSKKILFVSLLLFTLYLRLYLQYCFCENPFGLLTIILNLYFFDHLPPLCPFLCFLCFLV